MRARTWHGVTKVEDADRYLEMLRETGFSAYRAMPGNLGGAIAVSLGNVLLGELSVWRAADVSWRAVGALGFLIVGWYRPGFRRLHLAAAGHDSGRRRDLRLRQPVIAVALAWAVGDEAASLRTALVAGLVVGAVALTRERLHRKSSRRQILSCLGLWTGLDAPRRHRPARFAGWRGSAPAEGAAPG